MKKMTEKEFDSIALALKDRVVEAITDVFNYLKKELEVIAEELPCVPIKPVEYIDLGLTSRTLWADRAEVDEQGKIAFYDYFKAAEMFGNKLPKSWQFQELLEECTWTWVENGYEVKGKNGNRIFLPITHLDCGYYWSINSKAYTNVAISLIIDHTEAQRAPRNRTIPQAVRTCINR